MWSEKRKRKRRLLLVLLIKNKKINKKIKNQIRKYACYCLNSNNIILSLDNILES